VGNQIVPAKSINQVESHQYIPILTYFHLLILKDEGGFMQKTPHITLEQKSPEQVVEELKKSPLYYQRFAHLTPEWKEKFLGYCTGKKSLPLTYDPFFKAMFNPDVYGERLSGLISSLLGVEVTVVRALPNEETMLGESAMMILDVLVEMSDGSLANVEVQKTGYLFAGERMSCYSSDLVMRQYSRMKGERGKNFTYHDIKKVYTIVIFEQSMAAFHQDKLGYLHRGKTTFDTGLQMELLQEYCLVALDVFREKGYPKEKSEQTAWLSLLATESMEDVERLVREYPWLEPIYADMKEYLQKPEEVLNMFSEALRILDHNTVMYMVEEQKKEIEKQTKRADEAENRADEAENRADEEKIRADEAENRADEEKIRADEAEQRADEAESRADEAEQRVEKLLKLMEKYGLSEETAKEKMSEFWEK
jgi:hypothetical protein